MFSSQSELRNSYFQVEKIQIQKKSTITKTYHLESGIFILSRLPVSIWPPLASIIVSRSKHIEQETVARAASLQLLTKQNESGVSIQKAALKTMFVSGTTNVATSVSPYWKPELSDC